MSAVDASILFLNHHEGMCCDCCEGHCPMSDSNDFDWWDHLIVFGDDHIGTSRLIVREDALTGLPPAPEKGRQAIAVGAERTAWAVVPESPPPLSARQQSPKLLDRIDRAGLTLHDGDKIVHVYLGDRHVGWCMWASTGGVVANDLPLIREVAATAGISIDQAATAVLHVREATS
jgi:hypothetical protein